MASIEKNNSGFNNAFFLKLKRANYSKDLVATLRRSIPESAKKGINKNKFLKKYYDRLRRVIIKPLKSPRVYIKEGISRMEFFEILHERNVEYVLLRWWHNLPEIPDGEDMDILIRDEHRDSIDDLLVFYDNGTGLKCDFYTIAGSKYGSRRNIPYFQSNLAHNLIETRIFYRGAYVPSPLAYFASLAYHAVFHKGSSSGLPGFDEKTIEVEHDYTSVLKEESLKLGLDLNISVRGIYEWLNANNFAPADDTLSKLVELKPELSFLQKSLFSDARGGDFIVYLVRERLVTDGLLQDFRDFLEDKFHFDVIDVRILNPQEKNLCTTQIRGGKWDRGPYEYSGGPPAAIISAYDYHPWPLDSLEAKKQTRMTNRNNPNAKYDFRDLVNSSKALKGNYNGVHSADNEMDAWFYVSQIGAEYQARISKEVELRRQRYAGKWSVKKVLSTSPISKIEIIKYGADLAVKKTFRPGKERYFRRELFAAKELSKELSFIPPLLEEGNGYIVVPYYENILNELSEREKKLTLISKGKEIQRVRDAMTTRDLSYINFSPESIIITQDNTFYCTGYSYLQNRVNSFINIDNDECLDMPKDSILDLPRDFNPILNSFDKVWEPYLGSPKNA